MIAAYVLSAAVGASTYLLLRRRKRKTRNLVSLGIFLIMTIAFSIWFIQTGGEYGIMGKNGITPDWAAQEKPQQQ